MEERLMEILRELSVWADDAEQLDELSEEDDFMEEVGCDPGTGWMRGNASKVIPDSHGNLPGRYRFHTGGGEGFPACDLILVRRRPRSLCVMNIIPHTLGGFTSGEYNAALEDFAEKVIRPFAEKRGWRIELTSGQFDLNRWMSEATAKKLLDFSRSANRGVGGAAPVDSERWLDFVVTAHREGSRLPAAMLRRWLVEDEGWYFEVADRLAGEYEFGGEVLTYSERQTA
jgi:hypothetical protein